MTAAVLEPRADRGVLNELPSGSIHNSEQPHDRCRPQRVLVVDDNELVQAGLRAVLAQQGWVASCLTVGSLEVAWDVARRHQPQLVILSTSVLGQSGLELCRLIHQNMPHVRVVLMSSEGNISASLARANGAMGFFPKQLATGRIVAAIKHVAEGGRIYPKSSEDANQVRLSRRELDVLQHLVSGLSNPEVAARLSLSRHTVKQHTSMVYRKLGVRNRAQAASRAREMGLVV